MDTPPTSSGDVPAPASQLRTWITRVATVRGGAAVTQTVALLQVVVLARLLSPTEVGSSPPEPCSPRF